MNKNSLNFIITVDSNCDLNLNVCKKNNIIPLQLTYIMDEAIYVDTMKERSYKTFYNKMRNGVYLKSGNADIYQYMDFWYKLLKLNLPILHICVSSDVNSNYKNANIAKQTLLENYKNAKILVLDSKLVTIGCGLLALKAAEYRNKNFDIEDCYNYLENIKYNINSCYTTKNIKYLNNFGKINANRIEKKSKIRKMLKINKNGELIITNKKINNRKMLKTIEENIKKQVIKPNEQTLFISHSDDFTNAKKYGEKLKNELNFQNVFYTQIGPSTGSMTGPGFIAMYFFGDKRPSN